MYMATVYSIVFLYPACSYNLHGMFSYPETIQWNGIQIIQWVDLGFL